MVGGLRQASSSKGVILKSRQDVEAAHEQEDEVESELGEDGFKKAPFGSGLLGIGPQLQVKVNGRSKQFEDGASLCSSGRWAPERRVGEDSGMAWELRCGFLRRLSEMIDVKKVLFGLACNHFKASPFSDSSF